MEIMGIPWSKTSGIRRMKISHYSKLSNGKRSGIKEARCLKVKTQKENINDSILQGIACEQKESPFSKSTGTHPISAWRIYENI